MPNDIQKVKITPAMTGDVMARKGRMICRVLDANMPYIGR